MVSFSSSKTTINKKRAIMKQDKCRINNHILKQKLVATTGREMRIPYKSEHSKEKINLTILMCQQLMSFIMSLMTNEKHFKIFKIEIHA